MSATVTDLFCGAGGSSVGAAESGMEIVMAANHWRTAIDVHQANHPDARHDCADISQADPRRYPKTDVLLASPECTNHSQAKGVTRRKQDESLFDSDFDPAAERSRATMWCVGRFAEQNHYPAIIVENVVEATKWTGWRHWLNWLGDLGYQHQILSHNSQDHGVAQSRDRLYVVLTKAGITPELEMERPGWCPRCDGVQASRQAWKNGRTVGRYRQQWTWACTTCGQETFPSVNPAAGIIDWSLLCPRIGDRTKPLADKTRARILAGLRRYGWVPIVTSGAGNGFERTPGNRARPVMTEPLPVQTCSTSHALALPPDAMIVPLRAHGYARSTRHPVPTVAASGNHHGLLMRNNTGGPEMVTPATEPARTMTTTGHQSLLMPYYGQHQSQTVDTPIGTIPTKDRWAMVEPDVAVDDCGFRMLEPHEIAAAMAFPDGYIPTEGLTKKDRVKLAGNAVTPPVMTWLTGRVLQALEHSA